jgi:hypothetical protein
MLIPRKFDHMREDCESKLLKREELEELGVIISINASANSKGNDFFCLCVNISKIEKKTSTEKVFIDTL